MKTRIDKYGEDESFPPKRVSKNTELYEEIKNCELDSFDIGSNAKVIADSNNQIDIDKLKDILEKNYQEPPKKRSMKFDFPETNDIETLDIEEEPKEYDINTILEQAREEKEEDYQKERLKKVRDTQYDILKSLEIEAKSKNEEKSKEELLELINTINLNEIQSKNGKKLQEEIDDMDPLDILTELKGDDNTVVEGAKEFTEEIQKFEINSLELKGEKEQEEIAEALDETLDKSFYTTNTIFTEKDFSDSDNDKGSIVVKILIVVVFLAIVAGLVIFLNEFLGLGWF